MQTDIVYELCPRCKGAGCVGHGEVRICATCNTFGYVPHACVPRPQRSIWAELYGVAIWAAYALIGRLRR